MKYLGIDYGEKRVGVAMTDESKTLAFPFEVMINDKNLILKLKELAKGYDVELMIIGESKDYKGKDNPIMSEIEKFRAGIEKELKVKTVYHPEFLTSLEAERIQGKNKMHDASAAAIILQSYLDIHK